MRRLSLSNLRCSRMDMVNIPQAVPANPMFKIKATPWDSTVGTK
jgi:hypothetical protein